MEESLKGTIEVCKKVLRSGDEHPNLCFILKDNMLLDLIQFEIGESQNEKVHVWSMLSAKACTLDANKVVLVHEAWMKSFKEEDGIPEPSKMKLPSEYSDRKECVVISVISNKKDDDTIITIPFTRDNTGVTIGDEEIVEGINAEGLTGEIFHKGFEIATALKTAGINPPGVAGMSKKEHKGTDDIGDLWGTKN